VTATKDADGAPPRYSKMSDYLEDLRRRMDAAAAALDFEEASRLRDQLSLLRGSSDPDPLQEIDTSRLHRQVPGQMGLGTSDQTVTPPPGWKPPKRPDPLTSKHRATKLRKADGGR